MVIRIDGPAPKLCLNITDYSGKMPCLSWCTVDSRDLTMRGDHIVAIAPRAGTLHLSAPEFSTGPKLSDASGFPATHHERDALDYLATPTALDGSNFTLAAVCLSEAKLKSPQNIFSLCSPKKNLRVLRQADGFMIKALGQDVLVGEEEWPQIGPCLVTMSASNGMLRLRIRDLAKTGAIAETPFENPNTPGCHAVFGADQLGLAADTPTPSPSRSWRGHLLEMLVFDHDILTQGTALSLLDQYFTEIYEGAAPSA
ncbi:MAG: hypothetical protein ACI9RO_001851 [Alteromonas macleodii]|jgi:hypothetical protein